MSASRRSNVRRSNVTACARCRSRKQRCDQNIPACSHCERAGVECVSVDIDGSLAPRSYIKNLEDRIAQLEIQLSQCNSGNASVSPAYLRPGSDTAGDAVGDFAQRYFHAAASSRNTIAPKGQALLLDMLAEPVKGVAPLSQASNRHRELLHDLQPEGEPALPTKDAAKRLVDTYFEHCEFFSPVISSRDDFLHSLEELYGTEATNETRSSMGAESEATDMVTVRFWAFLVFATAVLLLNRTDSSFPVSRAETYFQAAMTLLHKNTCQICTGDETHLSSLTLLVQYSCFASNLSMAWHFLGLATRLAVEHSLHNEIISQEGGAEEISDATQRRRWLFWSVYTYERNLCVILGRPFSIPDEAIHTPLPTVQDTDTRRVYALHLIKSRRLESEAYTTLHQLPPLNGAVLDLHLWRESFRDRLISWRATIPFSSEGPTQLAPHDIFDGQLHNVLVFLFYPSACFPNPALQDLTILAHSAIGSIGCYKRAFRDGHLRFYWRTIHNLFRAGVAAAYCLRASVTYFHPELDQATITASINTCLSVLWAMVERYPSGKVYRDVYDNLATTVLKQADNSIGDTQSADFQFNFELALGQDSSADFPQNAIDTIRWGFGDVG